MDPKQLITTCFLLLLGSNNPEVQAASSLADLENEISNSLNIFIAHNKPKVTPTKWGYDKDNGPDTWLKSYPDCGGKEQSPVDISENTVEAKPLPKLKLQDYRAAPETWTLFNDGRTVTLTGNWPSRFHPAITNGPFTGRFLFHHVHFHWGSRKGMGSEHTIHGKKFPLESHFVHYNAKYGSYEDAAGKPDGLVVLGVLYKLKRDENEAYEYILKALSRIKEPEAKTTRLDPMRLGLLLPNRKKAYYTYKGSLTTPPCSQEVTWIIFQQPVRMTDTQMQSFRSLRTHGKDKEGAARKLVDNYRPIQPLNGRRIFLTLIR